MKLVQRQARDQGHHRQVEPPPAIGARPPGRSCWRALEGRCRLLQRFLRLDRGRPVAPLSRTACDTHRRASTTRRGAGRVVRSPGRPPQSRREQARDRKCWTRQCRSVRPASHARLAGDGSGPDAAVARAKRGWKPISYPRSFFHKLRGRDRRNRVQLQTRTPCPRTNLRAGKECWGRSAPKIRVRHNLSRVIE